MLMLHVVMQNVLACTQSHGTPNHLYGGGQQLFLPDYPKQHAPSPLRARRCYLVRSHSILSITGGAVWSFTERAGVSALGLCLWACMQMLVCLFIQVYVYFYTSPYGVFV